MRALGINASEDRQRQRKDVPLRLERPRVEVSYWGGGRAPCGLIPALAGQPLHSLPGFAKTSRALGMAGKVVELPALKGQAEGDSW